MKSYPLEDNQTADLVDAAAQADLDRQKWWVLIAIGIGTFMSALDTSVVNTVLPLVNRTFQSDIAQVEWVVVVYLLGVSGLLLSFGRLGDLRGHRPVYLFGFLIFIGSSVACSLAGSVTALVAARAVQAIGAAMLSANSPAILTKSFPAAQRGQALGLQATMTYLGLTTGPTLGGWLTDQFSWRAVFFINVPVGLFALYLSYRFVPHDEARKHTEQFDLPGAVVFLTALISLLLGLNQGHNWGWTSPQILFLLSISVLLLMLFLRWERRAVSPMLDLSLFSSKVFSTSVASAVFNYICVYSIIFLMPFYLIQGRQLSPSQAGLALSVQPLVMAVVAPVSGTLSDRIGARLPSTFGMLVLGTGLFMLSRLGPQTPFWQVALGMAVVGLGTGTFISPNNSALMGAAPRKRQGIAAGVLATARSVGMVLGVGLAGAVFTTILSRSSAGNTLFDAFSASLLVAAGVAGLGVLTSATRSDGDRY